MSEHVFPVYCDICHEQVATADNHAVADKYRATHFADEHPDNPMVKQNCRIKRYPRAEA